MKWRAHVRTCFTLGVIVGSANLSEQAFSGRQPETLVTFDNDEEAWAHYNRMFDEIRTSASDEIPLPKEKVVTAEAGITHIKLPGPK